VDLPPITGGTSTVATAVDLPLAAVLRHQWSFDCGRRQRRPCVTPQELKELKELKEPQELKERPGLITLAYLLPGQLHIRTLPPLDTEERVFT
jgi:hypothetical protein